ncbi:MAG: ABC transporter permease [Gammaproteobacteria bacterium]|nr:ABC transporter permease [Gammaproteobacteria bacterium]
MKYLPLVWAGIWRKRGRTILIFLQVAVAFTLFGVLQGIKTGADHAIASARADLLIVHSRLSWAEPLPLGMLGQIGSVPGVREVIPVDLSSGTYQNPEQQVGIVAVRPDKGWLSAFTYTISPAYVKAFRATRTAILVRAELAKKYGWKIGDRIPLKTGVMSRDGSSDWTFDMVGTFTDSDVGGGDSNVLINYDYWNEARAGGKDTVHHFNVRIADPRRAASESDAIDARFANSPNETRSESIRELAQANLQSIGDLEFLIRAVVAAVMAALLFATATMMIQSVRERTSEIAVLKTVGFTDGAVFALTLAEATVICVAAAGFGLAVATFAFPYASRFVHGLSMPWIIVLAGLVAAVVVALLSAAVPAILAARLEVAAALAER